MENYGELINELIRQFENLPGIGRKSAIRLAFHIINSSPEDVKKFVDVINYTRSNIKKCSICHTITDRDVCSVCSNSKREKNTIMVVETTKDMMAYERIGQYEGVYHILDGVISPKLNIGPKDINLITLLKRLQANDVKEVIIATSSTLEGETTAMYLSQILRGTGIKTTKIASGVPVGGDLDTIDEVTLLRALNGRFELNKEDEYIEE